MTETENTENSVKETSQRKIKAIRYNTDKYWNCYAIADAETGEILDDAQGYGYKTAPNAYRCWYYKHRDKSKDKEKRKKEYKIKDWLKIHRKDIEQDLQDTQWYYIKDGIGEINTEVMKNILKEHNLVLPETFTAFDLLKYCKKQNLWL